MGSLKKYNSGIFTNTLKIAQFPNYSIFSNVNVAYSDLLNKISDTINNVAPIKEARIKIRHKTELMINMQMLQKLEKNLKNKSSIRL